MKKLISIILLVLMIIPIAVSCASDDATTTVTTAPITTTKSPDDATTVTTAPITTTKSPDEGITDISKKDPLDRIYEIGSSYFNSNSEKAFNHKNIISSTMHQTFDANVQQKKQVIIHRQKRELNYKNTVYYPDYNITLYQYLVDENSDNAVLIDKDGAVTTILYDFAKVNVLKNATPEEVLPFAKEILGEYTDISKYNFINTPADDSKNINGFGAYDFVFYNLIDGYQIEAARISIKDDGTVFGLSIINSGSNILTLNIDKALENEMIELKTRDIYTTNTTEYISYKIDERFHPTVINRNDGIYVKYAVSTQYKNTVTGAEKNSWLLYILIPLDLITAK